LSFLLDTIDLLYHCSNLASMLLCKYLCFNVYDIVCVSCPLVMTVTNPKLSAFSTLAFIVDNPSPVWRDRKPLDFTAAYY
jgi:hypothetical protein